MSRATGADTLALALAELHRITRHITAVRARQHARSMTVSRTGESWTNTHPCRVEAHVYGGAVMQVRKRDVTGTSATVALGSNVAVRLEPGEAVTIEYAERPEWTWFGD